ncbi:MAG: sodium-dependent transporter [Desulfobacteraceae bacterium]|nr:sodium-dependent transporter [Desulfobacteraceae bacterium]
MAEEIRERWTSRTTFLFAAIGSAIGLGNLWRFPYLAYDNGGGAFLVAWIIGLLILGIPWLLMEIGMGRMFQKGAPGVFSGIGKKWEWLGWWPVLVAFLIVSYYAVIIAWSMRFVLSSATMAWGTGQEAATKTGGFFFENILQISSSAGELGSIVWPTLIMLAIVWIVLFLIMYKGAGVIGKIAVYTVSIPWLILVALLIRGLTLPGAADGLNYYLSPDWSALLTGDIWFAAFSQIAFTLSVGMAGMYAYGSFIARRGDVNNNVLIAGFANNATSFFAGFAVFSTLGFLMTALSAPAGEVAESGLGLAFVIYPAAISMMPTANALTGILFFLCLFFLGLDSAFFLAHGGVSAPLRDKFGGGLAKVTAIVCVTGFLVGAIFTTQGGLYWLDMFDRAAAFYGLLITGAISCIVIGWFWDPALLRNHVNETSDVKIGAWWDWIIKIVLPVGLIFVLVYGGFMQDIPKAYGGYEIGILNGSHVVWIILLVTLVASFVLQKIKTRG